MSYSRIVSAFKEVDFIEQASGEELSSVGSRPNVGVVEPKPVVSSEQGKPDAFKSFLEFYKSLSLVL
jgi:hypothetical protein